MPNTTTNRKKCSNCKYIEDVNWCPVFCFRVTEEELNTDANCRQWQKQEE